MSYLSIWPTAALKKANWPTKVKTGREAFAIGNNVRNVLQEEVEDCSRGCATKEGLGNAVSR